mmetsp:Transcript_8905/g.15432  ORF Transcript_8905/g.15432 Transcript_8905/m.15432 type:complete len:142 (+) Transcript_8905:106-531(+)
MGSAGRSTKTHSNKSKKQNVNKAVLRAKFEERHVDQVWEDVRKPIADVHKPGQTGPRGTTANVDLDDEVPGQGKHYCIPCARYFQTAAASVDHEKTKGHKRTIKMLMTTARPHNQKDAEHAGGLGKPDNGPPLRKLRSMEA